jgi:hypothetical protein
MAMPDGLGRAVRPLSRVLVLPLAPPALLWVLPAPLAPPPALLQVLPVPLAPPSALLQVLLAPPALLEVLPALLALPPVAHPWFLRPPHPSARRSSYWLLSKRRPGIALWLPGIPNHSVRAVTAWIGTPR